VGLWQMLVQSSGAIYFVSDAVISLAICLPFIWLIKFWSLQQLLFFEQGAKSLHNNKWIAPNAEASNVVFDPDINFGAKNMPYKNFFLSRNQSLPNYLIFFLFAFLTILSPAHAEQVINNANLQTWWHANYELNGTTAVADASVRRSTIYDVKVYPVADTNKYDSFVYMSIPRSGRDKWGYTSEDGAEFAKSANLSMSWSSFIYASDVWVDITLKNGKTISSINDVVVRPVTLNLTKEMINSSSIRIRVPYSINGYRFSVEFNNELYTAYNDMSGASGKLTTSAAGNREIHTEPRNSLLIFAEPKLAGADADRLIPKTTDGTIYYPPQGEVTNLNNVSANIIYFGPGTYYMPWNYHAVLPANVKWVYLAPGAFVKGAFRFYYDTQSVYKVTGYGALSGEKYVYEPDTANGYQHRSATSSDCHSSCVKMLQFQSSNPQQYLDLQGITIVEPPYHSFVVYGNEDTFQMRVENYKQVGSWYWQTDGLELYTNSTMKNTFFHSNDDVLKVYHNNVTVDNTVIWKNENGPVIQWGWTTRNLDNVSVKNTYVIHNRMWWKDKKINTCVINASPYWADTASTTTGNPSTLEKNLIFENLFVEGKTNCAMRIYALSSLENVLIKNLKIDGWSDLDIDGTISEFKRFSNSSGQQVNIGNEKVNSKGLKLENYMVGGQYITRDANNWGADKLGRLGFDADLYDNWNAWKSDTASSSVASSSAAPSSTPSSSSSSSLRSSVSSVASSTSSASSAVASALWVAGSFNSWALSAMTYSSGNFEITSTLSAGNHQLKFANTGNWTGNDWGNTSGLSGTAKLSTGGLPNLTFTITTAGTYIIKLDPVTLNYSITLKSAPLAATWVAGSFNSWALAAMTNSTNALQYISNLSAGSYELKFANTGNWTGKDWGNANGLSGTAAESTGGLPNLKFTITTSGRYTISFNPTTLAYSVVLTP
jgi:hypothetical protein